MQKKQASSRKEKESEALRHNESWLRVIMENTSDGINIAEYDPQTGKRRLVLCNDRYVEMSGRSREELMEADDLNRFVHGCRPRGRPFLEQVQKGLPSEGTSSWLRPDDKENFFEWTATPLKVGDKYHIIGINRDITERKRSEEALSDNESKYKILLENLPQMIFYKDRNLVYVSCNENFARSVKIKVEEIPGKTDYDFFPRKLADKYRTDDKRIMDSGEAEDIEEKFIEKGKDLFVRTVKTPVIDAKGDVVGVLGIFWDITEHKQAEEALLESEETARALLNATQDLALMIDPDGTLLAVNDRAAAKEFGKTPSELIGKNVRDTDQSGMVEHRLAQSDEVVHSGKPLRFEDEHDEKWLDHSVYPIFDGGGKVVRLAIFATDITERKQAEKAMRDSEYNLRMRVRELDCLYDVTEVVNRCNDSLDDLLQGIVDIIPQACQHPENACARITFGGKKYRTGNFRKSQTKLAADVLVVGEKVGIVEILCLKASTSADESPFLKEERYLIDTIAARIGRNIERIQIRRQLLAEQSALEQKNVALREVMTGIQDEKKEFGRRIVSNVEKIVMPLLHTLEQELHKGQRKYLDLLKESIEDITLPFADSLSKEFASLTPTEIRICNLIRSGMPTKEIASLYHISSTTVNKHREHIRRKLQITNKDVNLASYLENYMSAHTEN